MKRWFNFCLLCYRSLVKVVEYNHIICVWIKRFVRWSIYWFSFFTFISYKIIIWGALNANAKIQCSLRLTLFSSMLSIQPHATFRLQNASWIGHQNVKIGGTITLNLKTTKAYQIITNKEYVCTTILHCHVKCADLCHNFLFKVTKKRLISGNYCRVNHTPIIFFTWIIVFMSTWIIFTSPFLHSIS